MSPVCEGEHATRCHECGRALERMNLNEEALERLNRSAAERGEEPYPANYILLCPVCDVQRHLQNRIESVEAENTELREKLEFLRSTCPGGERGNDEPGFTQAEAYFWKRAYEGRGTEIKKLEVELRKEQRSHRAHEAGQSALERRIKNLEQQVDHWKKKFNEKVFAND